MRLERLFQDCGWKIQEGVPEESNKFLKLVIVICKTLSYNVTEFDLKNAFNKKKHVLLQKHMIHIHICIYTVL